MSTSPQRSRKAVLLVLAAAAPAAAWCLPRPATDDAPGARVTAAAQTFLASLTEADRATAQQPFDGAERTNWNFVPGIYVGLPLRALDVPQRRALRAVLGSALGASGLLKIDTIARLESELRSMAEAAGRTAEVATRDPERYAVAVFGTPSGANAWGFRYQGHHVSLNFTVVDGAVAVTPLFLGANPDELRTGPFAGQRVLGAEEDAARALLASLDDAQRARAILAPDAPADVLLGPGRATDLLGAPKGLPWTDLDDAQRRLLRNLVEVYVGDLAVDLAVAQRERLDAADGLPSACFAWLGSTEPGAPRYYRIHGTGFVIEYDNTQNGANHSHRVWHDLRSGFGTDLLRAHLEAAHRKR